MPLQMPIGNRRAAGRKKRDCFWIADRVLTYQAVNRHCGRINFLWELVAD
jgi:hypothetical protein